MAYRKKRNVPEVRGIREAQVAVKVISKGPLTPHRDNLSFSGICCIEGVFLYHTTYSFYDFTVVGIALHNCSEPASDSAHDYPPSEV